MAVYRIVAFYSSQGIQAGIKQIQTGSITLVQRFGGAVNMGDLLDGTSPLEARSDILGVENYKKQGRGRPGRWGLKFLSS